MSNSEKKTRKPVELSSIINVVQHNPKSSHKTSRHKMEIKSVVHVKSDGSNSATRVRSRQDGKSAKSSRMMLEKPMLLLPFGHQVSGRASMLCYDETTILKSYVSRELFFYQSMPQKLKKFTPQFRGLVSVSFVEDSSTASVLAYALPCTLVKPNAKSIIKLFAEEPKPHSKRCVKDFGKTHVILPDQTIEHILSLTADADDCNMFVEPVNFDTVVSTDQDDDVVSDLSQGFDSSVCIGDATESGKENRLQQKFSSTGLQNPWNAKVLDDAWVKLKVADAEDPSSGKKKRFTLLENVVASYRRPCVLDLKIGTRIRENASEDKVARHVTAINIGARLSGMQIYHPDNGQFSYHNKYYGHNLSIAGFKANLRHFFSRGTYPMSNKKEGPLVKFIDRDLVKQAITKLKKLKEIIGSMESHRFYSSSLLLLYEGDVSLAAMKDSSTSAYVRMDNTCSSAQPPEAVSGVSPRLFSLSDFLQRLKHSKHDKRATKESESRNPQKCCKCDLSSTKRVNSCHADKRKNKSASSSKVRQCHDCKSSKHRPVPRRQTSRPSTCKHTSYEDSHDSCIGSDALCHHKPTRTSQRLRSANGGPKKSSSTDGSSSVQHELIKSRKVKSQIDLTCRDSQDIHDHAYSKFHGSRSRAPYLWKSWPTRSKRMRMNALSSKDHIPTDSNPIPKHEFGLGLYTDHDDHDANHDMIDVRMIDFAHYCFRDGTMHPGPDNGFIFGLDNLIVLLDDMLKL